MKNVGLSVDGSYAGAVNASIGDTVYFALTAKMHARVPEYDKYYLEIVDTLPSGFTFGAVEAVYVNSSKVADKAGETGTVLADAKFKVHYVDDSGIQQYIVAGEGTTAGTYVVSGITEDFDEATELVTNSVGQIELKGLTAKEHHLEETEAPQL